MSMLKERLQILISPDQRRRLEAEAKRRGSSIATLVREAIDERYGATTTEDRLRAVDEIAALRGRFLTPAELEQLIAEERDAAAGPA
jgi:predicted DNA-binding protein